MLETVYSAFSSLVYSLLTTVWIFLSSHYIISGVLTALTTLFWYSNVNGSCATSENTCRGEAESGDRSVSPIPEVDDDSEVPSTRVAVGMSGSLYENNFGHKWSFAPRKIYKSIVRKGHRLTHDAADLLSTTRPLLRRRHSTGPFRIASAAKDLLVNGRKFRRQTSDFGRSVLPRPPAEFFEPSDLPKLPSGLSPEIFYVSDNLKALELPGTWKLNVDDIKVEDYNAGDVIVKNGDVDYGMIVVLEGAIAVYIRYGESKEYMVRRISKGDSFSSPLSLLEILMGFEYKFRNVSVRALFDCRIARYSMVSFRSLYVKNPRVWMRPIQIAIIRLLHVTMTTLHHYLGLRSELLKKRDEKKVLEEKFESLKHSYTHEKMTTLASDTADGVDIFYESCSYVELGRKYFADALNLTKNSEAMAILNDCMRIISIPENGVLTEQNNVEDRLFVVVDGTLQLTQQAIYDDEGSGEEGSVTVYPKELLGGLWLLTSEPSFYTVRACTNTKVAVLSKEAFTSIWEVFPEAVLFTAYSVLRRLSPFVRSVDFAIDWVVLDSGQAIYRSGDAADSFFVVLSGRLRSVEKKTVVEEFGRGDVVGMIEVVQRVPRSTTVLAVRLSQLACIPEGLLNYVKMKFPQVGFRLVHLLGQHYSSNSKRATTVNSFSDELAGLSGDPRSHIKNLHTIALVPASNDVPLVPFVCELYHALSTNLRVLRLSSQKVADRLGHEVLEKRVNFRLMNWLNLQEDIFPLVIYVCDYAATNWTGICLRQADAILLVANGLQKPPKHSFMEEYLSSNPDGIRTNKELVLLWDEDTVAPSGTFEWLKERWFSGHHHIRCPGRMMQWNNVKVDEKSIINYYQINVFGKKIDRNSDFSRLGRILTGNAVGLVLGGGGARGAAHIGVIKAMQDKKIPVDMIAGVSIGSLIGGLYADSPTTLKEKACEWFQMMGSVWRQIWDLTYAHSAMFTGAGFNKTLLSVFGGKQIEDLWISYFCISTDISESVMRVHRRGPLWAYIRSSMSLAGYLPPLCDPIDGHLLLDGGYVNNLPADVMKTMGAKIVIAVDVGSASDTDLYNYGDSLSGFWVLFKRLNPFSESVKVLNMEEIQSRLAYVSCVRHLEQVKKASYCHYVRPPIDSFKTLDFAKFEQIVEIGHNYGSRIFSELLETDEDLMIATGAIVLREVKEAKKGLPKHVGYTRSRASSFANLAAQVSRIPKNQSHGSSLDDDLEDDGLEKIQEGETPNGDKEDQSLGSELGYSSEPCTIQKEFFFSDASADEEICFTENEDNGVLRHSGLTEFYFNEGKAAENFRSESAGKKD